MNYILTLFDMEKITLFLFVLAGAFIALMFGWNEAVKKPGYRFLIFFKQNIVPFLFNIACGIALTYATENVTRLYALVYGSAGQYWFKKLQNVFDPDYPTFIGMNE